MGLLNFILDTNAIIYFQKGALKEALPKGYMAISVITEIELRGFPGLSMEQDTWLTRFLADIQIAGLNNDIKEAAIRLRRCHRIKLPDAIIAATALSQGAVLLTNDEHLHTISELTCRKLELKEI